MKHDYASATDTVFMASWRQKLTLLMSKLSLLIAIPLDTFKFQRLMITIKFIYKKSQDKI